MPEYLLNIGAAGAVIYVVGLFLKTINTMNGERQTERKEWLDCLMSFQSLMQKMIDKCPGADEVKASRR